jgi:hypothetical protein
MLLHFERCTEILNQRRINMEIILVILETIALLVFCGIVALVVFQAPTWPALPTHNVRPGSPPLTRPEVPHMALVHHPANHKEKK